MIRFLFAVLLAHITGIYPYHGGGYGRQLVVRTQRGQLLLLVSRQQCLFAHRYHLVWFRLLWIAPRGHFASLAHARQYRASQ